MRPSKSSGYDMAQICLNGHIVNDQTERHPHFNKRFCEKCGAETVVQCQQCGTGIQGKYHVRGVASLSITKKSPPAYCADCGSAYPWTERKLQAAKDLVSELDDLSESERTTLSKSVDDLVRDNAQTPVAATRFKKVALKLGTDSASALKDILIDVVSKTAKSLLWPS